jgi:ArsR family transcriptional regulator
MKEVRPTEGVITNGDRLLATLSAIANPQRLRILAALDGGSTYVSQLARELKISRPLLYLHIQRLEAVGLVKGHLELGDEGKAMKYFEVVPFQLQLDPAAIRQAVETLTTGEPEPGGRR